MTDRASYATPMEYEFQNKRGPVDENSPFITATSQSQQSIFRSNNNRDVPLAFSQQGYIDNVHATGKRPFSQYTSPAKSQFPQLRTPGGERTLFSDLPKDKPLPPNPSLFNTPRSKVIDFSSGGETPDTVDNAADNEATPDTGMGMGRKLANFFGGSSSKSSPKKSMVLSKGSPGKGEIAKPVYSSKIVKRREKRKTHVSKRVRHNDDESDSEAGTQQQSRKVSSSQQNQDAGPKGPGAVASFFAWIEAHPNLPNTLSYYVQFAFDFAIAAAVMYLVYSFWATIRADVDKKSQEAVSEVMAEMAICAKHWQENQCDPEKYKVGPALGGLCREWQKCMEKDPQSVGRAKVSAHTFAEILNSFVEPISWKAFIFGLALTGGAILFNHMAMSAFRSKLPHSNHYDPYMNHPPPTPQRHPSGGWDYGYTPYGNHAPLPPPNWGSQQALEPAPSQGSQSSPMKGRLEFR